MNILRNATAHLNKNSGEAEFAAASVVAAKALAAAGIPAAMARSLMAKGAYEGAAKNGYDINSWPMGSVYKGKIDAGIDAAMQGYQSAKPGEVQGPPSPRALAKGGHVAKDEPVVVGEEGPETFVPDRPGTVVPHMPQPGRTAGRILIAGPKYRPRISRPVWRRRARNDAADARGPRPRAEPDGPDRQRTIAAQCGQLARNDERSKPDRSRAIAHGGQPKASIPVPSNTAPHTGPAPAAEPPDPTNPMAQALGYGSIKRRPMQIGRQSYSQ